MPTAIIIDDDAALCRLLALALRSKGVDSTCISSAEVGVVELASRVFDYALIDVILPGGSGLYVLEAIRRMEPAMRPAAFVMTAGAVPPALDRSIIKGILFKPLDVNAVAAFVSALPALPRS